MVRLVYHNQSISALALSQHMAMALGWDWTQGPAAHLTALGDGFAPCWDQVALLATMLDADAPNPGTNGSDLAGEDDSCGRVGDRRRCDVASAAASICASPSRTPTSAGLCNRLTAPYVVHLCAADTTLAHQLVLGPMSESWYAQLADFFQGSAEHVAPWRIHVSRGSAVAALVCMPPLCLCACGHGVGCPRMFVLLFLQAA